MDRYSNIMNPKHSIDCTAIAPQSNPSYLDDGLRLNSQSVLKTMAAVASTGTKVNKLSAARRWVLAYIENLNGYCDSINNLRLLLKATDIVAVIDAYDGIVLEIVRRRNSEQMQFTYPTEPRERHYYESAV